MDWHLELALEFACTFTECLRSFFGPFLALALARKNELLENFAPRGPTGV